MQKWLIIIWAAAATLNANEWQPPERFLKAVRHVESSGGQFLVGDEGRSLGEFQLSEAAWLDVNSWREARALKTYDYKANVMNAFINRVYASNYLTFIHEQLRRRLGRQPSLGEMYAAYNMGLKAFADCGFKLARVNATTRNRCEQIEQMVYSGQGK